MTDVRRPSTRRPGLKFAASVGVCAAVAAGAGYWFEQLGYEVASATPAGDTLACVPVVGETASSAEQFLVGRGYRLEWRYTEFERAPDSVGATGYTHVRARVPAESVVEGVAAGSDASRLILFVRSPSDPHAPALEWPDCTTAMVTSPSGAGS